MPGTKMAVERIEHLMVLAIPYSGEDPRDVLVDLVADMMLHCAATDGLDWYEIVHVAEGHFNYELDEEQASTRLNDDYEDYVGQGDHGYRS